MTGKSPGEEPGDNTIRLNKYIAHSGICSRRKAEEFIKAGTVKVNGHIVKEIGFRIGLLDIVEYRGKIIRPVRKLTYLLMNKTRDIITSTQDEKGRKTVLDYIHPRHKVERIYPVGRLDRNTTGLLLLTNDGDLAKKLTHPSHGVKKIYHVVLDKPLIKSDLTKIRSGLVLEDGPALVDQVNYAERLGKQHVMIELHIGKNRIVRRIFEHLGYQVEKLDRVYYAGLTKKHLQRGRYRPLTEDEIRMLKHFT